LVYSLILPSSWFGVVREESGAKLVVRDCLLTSKFEQKNDCSRAERRGEGRDWFLSSQDAEKARFGLDRPIWFEQIRTTHKTDGMGASGAVR
jgi:hypothetical protein